MADAENADAAPSSTSRLLLVDLCGTLYDSNTTFDFLHYFLSGDAAYRRFESDSKNNLHRLVNRLMPGDVRRRKAISFLNGYSRQTLLDAASAFLHTIPAIGDVQRYVDEMGENFDRRILLSSSLDFIVEAACRHLGFHDYRATRLGYAGEVCEGRIETDLLGAKQDLIRQEFAGDECVMITDNVEDAACKAVVAKLIGVARGGDAGAMKFWQGKADEVVTYTH